MAQFIVEGESRDFFKTHFIFKSPEEADELQKNPELMILDWLKQKGYSAVLGEVLFKSIFPGLLSDFCHFIYEALSCSRKGKTTVAYALLRKPLKENLYYIEWMLADQEGLLNAFYNQPSKELEFRKIGNPEKAKAVITDAIGRTFHKDVYDPGFIYNLRFNKEVHFGFDGVWNQAIHLITTSPPIATEQTNFNFIFSGDNERWVQWRHIYSLLPYLLFYALDVCEALMASMAEEIPSDLDEVSFHRSIGFLLWAHDSRRYMKGFTALATGLEALTLNCPKCERSIKGNEKAMYQLYSKHRLRCPHCGKTLKLPHFVKNANNPLHGGLAPA